MPEWYFTRTRVSRIKCFIADMMEPYVIVKHSPSTPMYDSRFIDYGFNKMSFIEKLRQMNFQTHLLLIILIQCKSLKCFTFRSPFRKAYLAQIKTTRNLYKQVLLELGNKYNKTPHFPICTEKQSNYYIEIPNE